MKTHGIVDKLRLCRTPGKHIRTTENVFTVDCDRCKANPAFGAEVARIKTEREREWAAATPRQVANPWSGKAISCKECGHNLFRYWGRDLWSNNHKCAKCGHMNYTMTETAMCT